MRKSPYDPCIPTRGTRVPAGKDWLHEIKHDGYRMIVKLTTISAMEGKGAATLGSGLDTIKAVMDALDGAGVELTNHGQPGCRLKSK